ncbi:E3 ubiquitin-protein ligase TRAIP-like [Bombus affinis]|uniref:E3 ubiquitin-protein ligase TRAIP-like n=1 Tax=Bombus affinis TaxID=309941 RepID=UPI0021B755C5|nr:E3 ubiquitin-protein ligase TRAIP-like [Bombus affinis]XP_050597938.1 E3 ubiquitin-protein ligase TRAIP-like [Bombus affinis]
MNIICVICSDLLTPSDDVFYTPCGHIFHFTCVTQWLERSKTCPQCRERTTSSKIHRLYFNFSNNDTIVEDKCSLQDKVDKLNFQLMLKEKDIKRDLARIEILERQNRELKEEIKKMEIEIAGKYNAVYALQEQIKLLKQQSLKAERRKKEIEQLQKKIEHYKNVQIILDGTTEDVDEMISRTTEPATLITYMSVMKREITVSQNKRRELRSKLKSVQQELTKVSMERNFLSDEHTKRKTLENEYLACLSEKMSLQNRLSELEKDMSSTQKPIKFNSKTKNMTEDDLSNDSRKDKIECINNTINEKKDIGQEEKTQSAITKNETNSPYLPVKSGGVFALTQMSQRYTTSKLTSSILAKKPRLEQGTSRNENNRITFDGFGGHSKYEEFPKPSATKLKIVKDIPKVKKPKFDTDYPKIDYFLEN